MELKSNFWYIWFVGVESYISGAQSPRPLEDESLIDGIVYDERSTKASPWGNEGKGCAMVECLATW